MKKIIKADHIQKGDYISIIDYTKKNTNHYTEYNFQVSNIIKNKKNNTLNIRGLNIEINDIEPNTKVILIPKNQSLMMIDFDPKSLCEILGSLNKRRKKIEVEIVSIKYNLYNKNTTIEFKHKNFKEKILKATSDMDIHEGTFNLTDE